jgi:hypothetical protein
MLDYSKPTAPIPKSLGEVSTKIVDAAKLIATTSFDSFIDLTTVEGCSINQLTINEYLPGQGIAAHIGNRIIYITHKYVSVL